MYESFFGLTGPPFRLVPDPSFLFIGRSHRDAFATLRAGLTAGARVMVLTGEVGAGKTTLVQALLTSVDPGATVTAHISAAQLDAETLSERLSEALGLPRQPDPLARRDALLAALLTGPRATLLVIDEAQHLAPSAVDLLEALANETAPAPLRLQICLVGQPELRILLNAAQRGGFRELIGVDRHLGPLEQAEIRLYVEHRLHRAGWTGRPEFEDPAFAEIFIFTAGNPRRVNLLCNSLMLCACVGKRQRIDAPAVTWAAAAMREDSFQGTPDVLDLGSHFEHRPTLTEAFRPDAAPESPGEAREAPGTALAAPPDAVHVDALGANAAGEPASLTMDGATSHEADAMRSEPSTEAAAPEASASPRRRQAILASVASAAVALALLAYLVDRQGSRTSLSQNELRDTVANRTTSPASPRTALDPMRRGVGSVAPPPSFQASAPAPAADLASPARALDATPVKAPQHGDSEHGSVADEVPGAVAAAASPAAPASAGAAAAPTPLCSGPAFALGLCDADSSSKRRQ